MKPFQKVIAALLAVIFVVSMASCAPVSLSKDWCYKYGDTKYDIGVYIYSLYNAYKSAEQYAQKAKGYKEGESFVDLEITDDDGKKAKASDWILEKADESTRELIVIDKLIAEKKVKLDKDALAQAEEVAQNLWDIGPSAAYGGYDPMSKTLEPYGVSFESFSKECISTSGNTPYSLKYSALFDALYGQGGSEEVSDKELSDFFLKNYVSYNSIPVKLYDSKTDDQGNPTNTKYDDKKTKEIKDTLEGYVDEINNGSSGFSDIAAKCEKKYSVTTEEEEKDTVKFADSFKTEDEDKYNSVTKLKNGKAELIVEGDDGDTPTAYIIVKNDIAKSSEEYLQTSRASVLQQMKSDDFKDLLKKEVKALEKDKKYEKNDSAIDKYDPDLFYEEPEETTAAAEDEAAQ